MPLITWNDTFSVGVEAIDNQHKRLAGMVNDLYDAMVQGKARDAMGDIFARLVDYTQVHFVDEEKLQKDYQYPEYDIHKVKHEDLLKQALELQKQFHEGSFTVTMETLTFLKDWLLNHIAGDDKKVGQYLNSKGIK